MSIPAIVAETSLRALPADSAEATLRAPGGGFPAVTATSRLIELMELAALRLMKPQLHDGETSVAVEMNITHAAPALMHAGTSGNVLRAVATYRGIAARLHRFTVHAFDESGLIATADHTRAVVVERRLLANARGRAGRISMLLSP